MILWNTSDDELRGTAAVKRSEIDGAREITFPPSTFFFQPNEEVEVPDMAAEPLMKLLEMRGLVRLPANCSAERKIALRKEGRLMYFRFLERQVQRHRHLNVQQRLNGLPPIAPNDQVLECYDKWVALKKTEFNRDRIMDAEIPLGSSEDALRDPQAMQDLMGYTADEAKAFEDRNARDAQLGTELPAEERP